MINDEFEILKNAARILDNKKAVDMTALDVGEMTVLTRYFLIVSGTSAAHIRALGDEIKEKMADNVRRVEGKEASGWVITDLGGVMVHIFSRQMRDFYALEHLWEGAKLIEIKNLIEREGEEK